MNVEGIIFLYLDGGQTPQGLKQKSNPSISVSELIPEQRDQQGVQRGESGVTGSLSTGRQQWETGVHNDTQLSAPGQQKGLGRTLKDCGAREGPPGANGPGPPRRVG